MKYYPKRNNAIAYLRQLCCSGLDKETVILEFLRAVQAVIPSGSNVFTRFDEQFENLSYMIEFSIPDLAEATPEILADFFTPECKSRFMGWLGQHAVLADATLLDASFYQSDMYNMLYRPYNQHHGLWGLVVQHAKPVGLLNLFRPRQQKPFDSHEQALCIRLLPYLAHALCAPDNSDIQYSENGGSGMMVMDLQGQIQYISPEAKWLLALACQPVLSLSAQNQEEALLAKLAQLCRNLQTVFQGKNVSPPFWSMCNGRGRFCFHTCWLNKQNNGPGAMIGITVEHQEPLVLKILRGLQNLPLSPVQKQVALLLAQGISNDKIGEHLNIKLSTVKDHVRKTFDKLGINRRAELLPMLLALDKKVFH